VRYRPRDHCRRPDCGRDTARRRVQIPGVTARIRRALGPPDSRRRTPMVAARWERASHGVRTFLAQWLRPIRRRGSRPTGRSPAVHRRCCRGCALCGRIIVDSSSEVLLGSERRQWRDSGVDLGSPRRLDSCDSVAEPAAPSSPDERERPSMSRLFHRRRYVPASSGTSGPARPAGLPPAAVSDSEIPYRDATLEQTQSSQLSRTRWRGACQ
jgi:hypothetical protein